MTPRPSLTARTLALTLALGAGALVAPTQAAVVATFDDLEAPPALDTGTGLQFTNAANSLVYQGVTWDARFSVYGRDYRVGGPGEPVFGIPHSGDYYVANQTGDSGLLITTDKVLTGAWFGRNEYYGFGGGADQITIVALSGATELASVVFDLPDLVPGLAEPLSFVDTSSFGALAGITGYRIDRRAPDQFAVNWVADDFQFRDANAVPLSGTLALLGIGLPLLGGCLRRRGA